MTTCQEPNKNYELQKKRFNIKNIRQNKTFRQYLSPPSTVFPHLTHFLSILSHFLEDNNVLKSLCLSKIK